MIDLASQKCVGHREVKLLLPEQVQDYLSYVHHWEFLESNKITREFEFSEFSEAMDFVNKVAKLAEEEGHHPDIEIHYRKVNLILWTHFVGGLSENDFIMAAKINTIG